MADETGKEKIKSKRWFVGPLSKIGATILTALVGFYVYDTLGREIIEIANIEVRQVPINIEIQKNQLSKELTIKLENYTVSKTKDSTNKPKTIFSEIDYKILLDKIHSKLKRIKGALELRQSDLDEINKIDPSKIDTFVKVRTLLRRYTKSRTLDLNRIDPSKQEDEFKKSKDSAVKVVKETIERGKVDVEDYTSLVENLVQQAYKQLAQNESNYQIEVVLFNSGGKQAVVRYKGHLRMQDDTIKVNLKKPTDDNQKTFQGELDGEAFLRDFVIINSKSFNGMTLVVDKFNNRQRDIKFSQREYAAGQQEAELYIYDINNKVTRKKKFNFRNVLYEEEKESFKSILDKEYKAFK